MTEISLRMFGDQATIAVEFDAAGHISNVAPIRANERCTKLIRSVGASIAHGKPPAEQLHNLIALGDLVRELLDAEARARNAA